MRPQLGQQVLLCQEQTAYNYHEPSSMLTSTSALASSLLIFRNAREDFAAEGVGLQDCRVCGKGLAGFSAYSTLLYFFTLALP